MWVVIERSQEDPQRPWISGVFKELQEAKKYIALDADFHRQFKSKPLQEIVEIPAQDYPVILVFNDSSTFVNMTLKELANKLLDIIKVDDEDHQYFVYTIFREDYKGMVPGENKYLQFTDHHHVVNGEIERLLWNGLNATVLGLEGIYRCDHCSKLGSGILNKNGYAPPMGWQIISEPLRNNNFLTGCSEKCLKELLDELNHINC